MFYGFIVFKSPTFEFAVEHTGFIIMLKYSASKNLPYRGDNCIGLTGTNIVEKLKVEINFETKYRIYKIQKN